MKYQANSTALSQSTDCLIIGIYENNELTKVSMKFESNHTRLPQPVSSKPRSFRQNWPSDSASFITYLATKRVLVAGCGKKGETTERQFKQIINV